MEIVVPELGESIVEATVARWLKQEGDFVALGEPVVELETDKVDLEVGAKQEGVLVSISHQEGEDVRVGEVLGVIEAAPGEEKAAQVAVSGDDKATHESAETGAEGTSAAESAGRRPGDGAAGERVTPVARRLAQEYGIDLSQVQGSGPGERVTKEDVQRYMTGEKREPKLVEPDIVEPAGRRDADQKVVEPEPAPARRAPVAEQPAGRASGQPAVQDRADRKEERIRMSRRRRTIASRLVEAQQTAAMLTTFNDVDMSAVMELRQRRRDSFQQRHGVKLGFMSFFVKAAIGALKDFPQLNAEIQGEEFILKYYYDIGIAVGAEEGLVVPVLRDAGQRSFAEIEKTIQSFIDHTRDGTLSLEDLRGGTFTITNGGVFGSLLSTPILNPPQVGILGLHRIEERPVAIGGQVVIRPMMYLALSYDHRIVDGREAVQFLVRLKELVQDPETLLLEG